MEWAMGFFLGLFQLPGGLKHMTIGSLRLFPFGEKGEGVGIVEMVCGQPPRNTPQGDAVACDLTWLGQF